MNNSRSVTLWQATRYWLRLGCLSFGGPAAQIAMMHKDLVQEKRWISDQRFSHALNYTMLLPGPEAQQLATYIGWLMHGTRGGLIAGGLFILPGFLVLILLASLYVRFSHVPALSEVFYVLKAVVLAIIVNALFSLSKRVLKHPLLWLIAVCAFLSLTVFSLPFPITVLSAALIGFLVHRHDAEWLKQSTHLPHSQNSKAKDHVGSELVVIDDNTPTPAHAEFSWSKAVKAFLFHFVIWSLLLVSLVIGFGEQSTLAQLGWFFTKASVVTFGGAYAVLPYVLQAGVETYGWLSIEQMMDGLALGETTPGPLILVVSFVGFIATSTQSFFGFESMLLNGFIGAFVVTIFTFLPCFMFIFVGGPLVETTRKLTVLQAPLQAITACVVGAIATLALSFAAATLVDDADKVLLDFWALALTLAAIVALQKFKWGVLKLISVALAVGALYAFIS